VKDAMRSVRAIDPRLQHAADVDKASCCFLAFNQESDDHQRLDFRDFNQAISFEHFETVSELRARAGESDLCKIEIKDFLVAHIGRFAPQHAKNGKSAVLGLLLFKADWKIGWDVRHPDSLAVLAELRSCDFKYFFALLRPLAIPSRSLLNVVACFDFLTP
jgi:hypothetical protein